MKIKMLKTMRGSPNGIDINEYKNGEVYNLPIGLAGIFIKEKWAVLVEEIEEKVIEIPETQVIKREKKIIRHREKK